MITFIMIGAVLGLLVAGLLVLRRPPAASTAGGVTLDIHGRRMVIPAWAWQEIAQTLTTAELQAFATARDPDGCRHDDAYAIIVIGRVQAVAWAWMTTTRQGRHWLSRTAPDLLET